MRDADPCLEACLLGEPALEDLIADPIVHAVLRRDGLGEDDLRRALERASAALWGRGSAKGRAA